MNIETIAAAIYREVAGNIYHLTTPTAWEDVVDSGKDQYRGMARAAVEALNLAPEYKYLDDGRGGQTAVTDGFGNVVRVINHSKPQTKMSRWVSPWVQADQ